jgi:AraC-like DNA-binding protein
MQNALPLLHSRRVYASRNADETGAFMAAKEFRLDLAPRVAGDFDFIANVAYMPGSYLGYIQYGAAATIHVPDVRVRDDYWMHVSLRGGCEIVNGAGSAVCSPNQAVFSSPRGHRTHSEAGSSRLTLSVTRATLLGRLAALLGDAPTGALDFAPVMDLTSRPGRRLIRHVQLALEELDESDEAMRNATFLGMYEELIVTAMLLAQPHSFTDRLQRLERPVLPRDVRRALEYIDAHLDAPVTLAGLAAVTGVPGRTLLKHFKDHHGVSPMRYWRDRRFARARDALLHARNGESVTDIATAWGFYHLGRFAMEYSRRFGENPSQTHQRATRKAC